MFDIKSAQRRLQASPWRRRGLRLCLWLHLKSKAQALGAGAAAGVGSWAGRRAGRAGSGVRRRNQG